jgi:AcrR family transcriptional regulator
VTTHSGRGRPRKARQIVETARRLFLDHGYDASSMDAIAREAGVSKATLYVHFDNKEALFAALIEEECRTITDRIWPADTDSSDVEATLRRIAENFTTVLLSHHGLAIHHLIVTQVARLPELKRIFWQAGPQKLQDRVSAYLRQANARGQLAVPDPDLAAIQFLSLVGGDLPMRRELSAAIPQAEVDRLIASGVRLFMAGYARRRR